MNEKTDDWRCQHKWHCYRIETKSCGMSYVCNISALFVWQQQSCHWTAERTQRVWNWSERRRCTIQTHAASWTAGIRLLLVTLSDLTIHSGSLNYSCCSCIPGNILCDFDCLCFHVNIWAHLNSEVTFTKIYRNLVIQYTKTVFETE